MDEVPRETETAPNGGRTGDLSPTDLSQFFKFPSLAGLFQGADRGALAEMRARLTLTSQNLERVIRQGTQADAQRAVLISRSYSLALTVLDELERHVADQ